MKKHYQQELSALDSFGQAYSNELEESRQRREYRDLYDPFKSSWKDTLESERRRTSEQRFSNRSKEYPGAQEKENFSTSAYRTRNNGGTLAYKDRHGENYGYSPYGSNQGSQEPRHGTNIPGNTYGGYGHRNSDFNHSLSNDPGGELSSHFQQKDDSHTRDTNEAVYEPNRNTYGYYTTGYGPRD